MTPLAIFVSTAPPEDSATRFVGLLARQGHTVRHLAMPESYATAAALKAPPGNLVHLIVRPTDQIRLLKPAVNICYFPCGLPVLSTETLPGAHPFLNQVRMLGLCDEVWTGSAYACGVLAAHGVANVHRIPAPVAAPAATAGRDALRALAEIPAVPLRVNHMWSAAHAHAKARAEIAPLATLIARHSKRPKIFMSVVDTRGPLDDIDTLLRGFHRFRAGATDALLIVQVLAPPEDADLADVAGWVVPDRMDPGTVLHDDGILLISAAADEAAIALGALGDFYLCTSVGEGQNLTLLQAMAQGAVAISPGHTAMADYLDADSAFVIPSRKVPNDSRAVAANIGRAFSVPRCTARGVADTLHRAAAEPRAAHARRARSGAAMVAARFGDAAIWPLVAARLAAHTL